MGGVEVGGGGGKRAVNSDVNMIPFIDLLMVTIAFLLITAVWTSFSRLNINAQVPAPPNPDMSHDPSTPEKILHLHLLQDRFSLVWKQGATVVALSELKRVSHGAGALEYDDLESKLAEEWKLHGGHQDPSDHAVDQAVLHVDNRAPFQEIIAVLDALYANRRVMNFEQGRKRKVPVFNMTFAVR